MLVSIAVEAVLIGSVVLAAQFPAAAAPPFYPTGADSMPNKTVSDPKVFIAIAPDGTVTIVAARAETDAVTLDLQHGLFDTRAAVECIRAIGLRGKAPLVRLPDHDPALIGFLLDAGAAGLVAQTRRSPRSCKKPQGAGAAARSDANSDNASPRNASGMRRARFTS